MLSVLVEDDCCEFQQKKKEKREHVHVLDSWSTLGLSIGAVISYEIGINTFKIYKVKCTSDNYTFSINYKTINKTNNTIIIIITICCCCNNKSSMTLNIFCSFSICFDYLSCNIN